MQNFAQLAKSSAMRLQIFSAFIGIIIAFALAPALAQTTGAIHTYAHSGSYLNVGTTFVYIIDGTRYRSFRGGAPGGIATTTSFGNTALTPSTVHIPRKVTDVAKRLPANSNTAKIPTTSSQSSNCALPKYPTASCTGVPAGTTLQTVLGDVVVTTRGQVIDGKLITGSLNIRANDVIVRNTQINGPVLNDSGSYTIEDSTVGPQDGCSTWSGGAIGYSNYTARRVRIRGFSDGFRISGSNVLIEDSYVVLCSDDPNDHSDGIQVYGAANGTNITIHHNTIDQRPVNNGGATAPIFIPNDTSNQRNRYVTVSVTDNVVAGGGFSLRVFGDLPWTALAISGNKIVSNTWAYGPVDVTCTHIRSWNNNSVIKYDWDTGAILEQVSALNNC